MSHSSSANLRRRFAVRACVAALALVPAIALGATRLELWHSMDGAAAEGLTRIVEGFNAGQSEYLVAAVFKGSEREAVEAGLAAQRAGRAPHLLQVDDAYSASLSASPRSFMPVYQVLERGRQAIDGASLIPQVRESSVDARGRLVSLPFNAATPVLYYNRDAFQAAGLDPDSPPRTWLGVQAAALKLVDTGAAGCGFTTESPTWVHVENLLTWHNEPLASVRNGPRGKEVRLVLNSRLMILHVGLLSSWVKSGIFSYFARRHEGERKFASGECAMLTGSSGAIGDIREQARFRLGVSPLPVHEDVAGAPNTTVAHGGRLWVMAGKKPAEYSGVASFLVYLSRVEVQALWHQATGYLPMTLAAIDLTRRQGFYERFPGSDVAVHQLRKPVSARDLHVAHAAGVHSIVDEELEAVWSRRKTPMDAVNDAVERGNRMLRTLSASAKLK